MHLTWRHIIFYPILILTLWSNGLQTQATCYWLELHHSDGCYPAGDWPAMAIPQLRNWEFLQLFLILLPPPLICYSEAHRLFISGKGKKTKRICLHLPLTAGLVSMFAHYILIPICMVHWTKKILDFSVVTLPEHDRHSTHSFLVK